MKRLLSSLAVAIFLSPTVAHSSNCEVEEIVSRTGGFLPTVNIEGVATCETGTIVFRFYNEKGGRFIGAKSARIVDFVFKAEWITGEEISDDFFIKYTIKGR